MKYSNIIGLVICCLVAWACFQKWVYIETPEKYLTGFENTVDNNLFGKPGKLHLALVLLAAACFAIPKIWAKRLNFLFAGLNLAWAIRNFFSIGMTCRVGTCPTKLLALNIIFFGSIILFVMALVPKLDLKENKLA